MCEPSALREAIVINTHTPLFSGIDEPFPRVGVEFHGSRDSESELASQRATSGVFSFPSTEVTIDRETQTATYAPSDSTVRPASATLGKDGTWQVDHSAGTVTFDRKNMTATFKRGDVSVQAIPVKTHGDRVDGWFISPPEWAHKVTANIDSEGHYTLSFRSSEDVLILSGDEDEAAYSVGYYSSSGINLTHKLGQPSQPDSIAVSTDGVSIKSQQIHGQLETHFAAGEETMSLKASRGQPMELSANRPFNGSSIQHFDYVIVNGIAMTSSR